MASDNTGLWVVGEAYHVRTLSHEFKALLRAIDDLELEFTACEWVEDSGRLYDRITLGAHNEIPEPIDGPFLVGRNTVQFARAITRTL